MTKVSALDKGTEWKLAWSILCEIRESLTHPSPPTHTLSVCSHRFHTFSRPNRTALSRPHLAKRLLDGADRLGRGFGALRLAVREPAEVEPGPPHHNRDTAALVYIYTWGRAKRVEVWVFW